MERYCFERDRLDAHRLLEWECHLYWTLYDRQRGFSEPIGYINNVEDAQRIVDALNQGG